VEVAAVEEEDNKKKKKGEEKRDNPSLPKMCHSSPIKLA
jgi:hypothetical protein